MNQRNLTILAVVVGRLGLIAVVIWLLWSERQRRRAESD
jgi:Flp pilus assembly protein CpaB